MSYQPKANSGYAPNAGLNMITCKYYLRDFFKRFGSYMYMWHETNECAERRLRFRSRTSLCSALSELLWIQVFEDSDHAELMLTAVFVFS